MNLQDLYNLVVLKMLQVHHVPYPKSLGEVVIVSVYGRIPFSSLTHQTKELQNLFGFVRGACV